MKRPNPLTFRSILAQASIWTISNHNFLAGQIRIYVWTGSAIVLFLAVPGIIPLHIALYALLFCGLAMLILLWILIQWRKAILLDIQDDKLKQTAHAAMLALIHDRKTGKPAVENQKGLFQRGFKKKSHS
jgi:ABC-type bacteriocin/lantibiotic exporter with double-glycine peptidase domain